MSPEEQDFPNSLFEGKKCPACGAGKTTPEDPFCEVCLILLPPDLRRALTNGPASHDTLGLILRSIVRFNAKGDGGVPDRDDKE